jgi:hypothetical protein
MTWTAASAVRIPTRLHQLYHCTSLRGNQSQAPYAASFLPQLMHSRLQIFGQVPGVELAKCIKEIDANTAEWETRKETGA